jgi:small-conductance mechanosensitive channel
VNLLFRTLQYMVIFVVSIAILFGVIFALAKAGSNAAGLIIGLAIIGFISFILAWDDSTRDL